MLNQLVVPKVRMCQFKEKEMVITRGWAGSMSMIGRVQTHCLKRRRKHWGKMSTKR